MYKQSTFCHPVVTSNHMTATLRNLMIWNTSVARVVTPLMQIHLGTYLWDCFSFPFKPEFCFVLGYEAPEWKR